MAADVDICNEALAYLGDEATVTSISPPEGSAQAGRCARFYPMALERLLEMHTWGFSTTRVSLPLASVNPTSSWKYAYNGPSDVVNYLEIMDPTATDDYSMGIYYANDVPTALNTGMQVAVPQPFVVETDANGNDLILTNQENAVLRYTHKVTDINKFSPLAQNALARLLASMLAGPLLKGDTGRAESKAQYQMFQVAMEAARESDANQRRIRLMPGASWMANR